MSAPNVSELLDRWRSGNELAGRTVMQHYVDVYAKPLLVRLRCLGVRTDDAEDIGQEAFVRFFLRLRRGFTVLPGGERKYLFTIAYRLTVDMWRDRSATRRILPPNSSGSTGNPEEPIIRAETKEHIQATLSKLPARQRRVVEMYYFDDLTLEEISAALGIATSTACSWLSQAKKNLAKILREYGDI